jgi:hypothetical protein
MELFKIIITILLPPLGVFLQVGIGKHFWNSDDSWLYPRHSPWRMGYCQKQVITQLHHFFTFSFKSNEGNEMPIAQRILAAVFTIFICFAAIGCEKEGPAEKAGKEIDKAFNTAKDKINEATK